jgi:peptidyl-prolyl cis-trans isomerase C
MSFEGRAVHADPSPSPVVARIGAIVITTADLERRLASVPPFQLATFGSTPDEIRKAFLERVMVREALLVQGAEARGLPAREDVRERTRNVLRNTLLARIRADVLAHENPTGADIKAYYDANAAKFHAPPRVALWEIIVAKREEADAVLAELKKEPATTQPKRWNELCRERSIDKPTNMRGGNLGFVTPDGLTSEPGLKVDPEILQAITGVKDGEIVPQPIAVSDKWAVVWKRQSMKAVDRPVEREAESIRLTLLHERTEARIKDTLQALRRDHLTDESPDVIELVEVAANGEMTPVRRPGSLPAGHKITATPVPSSGPNGIR